MPPAAKKTVAKKAAPKKQTAPKSEAPKQETPDRMKFPLQKGRYYSVPVLSRKSASSGDGVVALQKALGVPESGEYDKATAAAVGEAQAKKKIPVTYVVDAATWDKLI